MCDGTSITLGTATTASNAYRQNVYLLGLAAGLTFTFLGKFGSGTPGSPWFNHMGVSGSTLADHMSGGSVDTPQYLGTLLPANRPSVIYHELVTNDATSPALVTAYGSNMTTYIAQLDALGPFRHVWDLCQIRENSTFAAAVTTINNTILSTIPTLVAGGTKIVACDSRVMQGIVGSGNSGAHFENVGAAWVHPEDSGDLFKAWACFTGLLLGSGRSPSWAGDWNG